ncbi:FtsH protease activity modulator HflK [Sedimentibacter sp. zth1]|uniref:FtsH protease activity modulator HflK n=1 Tax=Sedimentibacter sp. zth1 TaxID=2816908 RepID=UPI001A921BD2|nr:FtsH protease activity modulator HflK [Sedimentibacter sp. zth1]QSX05835.1 FtsH protease activity modulator HflK [Sedimentibacter sp. zth1]
MNFNNFFNKKNNNDTNEYSDSNQNYKKTVNNISSKFKIIAIIVIILVFAVNAAYQVKEQEQAIILTFGKPTSTATSGLHFKLPFIQAVKKVDTTTKGLTIGYSQNNNQSIESESLMITGDYNFVNVDFFVEYKVSDPIKNLYSSYNPVLILKNICQSSIRTIIGSTDVDSVLTTGKAEIQAKTKEDIIEKLQEHNIGLQIVNVTIQDAEPPTTEVMEAFKQVETAKQSKETAINNANKYRNEKLPEARANADKITQNAEGQKQERINEAIGQVARFNKMYEEYIKYPEITKKRMFFETMEEIMPNLEVIIDNGDGSTQKVLPLKPFTSTTGGN